MNWQPIETVPGYTAGEAGRLLFLGYSKAGSFSGPVVVSGWVDHDRKPVHNYSYKLTLTYWAPFPEPPQEPPHAR